MYQNYFKTKQGRAFTAFLIGMSIVLGVIILVKIGFDFGHWLHSLND